MLSLLDPASSDAFTLALIDSIEQREPAAVLAVHRDGAVTLHGPIAGRDAAANHAPALALHDVTVTATRPVRLHTPGDVAAPAGLDWVDVPAHIAASMKPAPRGVAAATAVVLLDQVNRRLVALGPLPEGDAAVALSMRRVQDDSDVRRLPVALLPVI